MVLLSDKYIHKNFLLAYYDHIQYKSKSSWVIIFLKKTEMSF